MEDISWERRSKFVPDAEEQKEPEVIMIESKTPKWAVALVVSVWLATVAISSGEYLWTLVTSL
jgi:hypothetical protein